MIQMQLPVGKKSIRHLKEGHIEKVGIINDEPTIITVRKVVQ